MPPSAPTPQLDQDLVRAVSHPTRVRILEALQGRTASPTELSRQFGESLGVVAYHANALLSIGCLEQVRTQPKRGTVEHFYTSVPRSFIGHQDWRKAPLTVRGGVTGEALRTFVAKVAAAIEADTIDTREDTTLNWMPITVDDRGWREVGGGPRPGAAGTAGDRRHEPRAPRRRRRHPDGHRPRGVRGPAGLRPRT